MPSYFLIFLSCFGFLTSFLRTLFPLLMTNSFWLYLPAARTRARKPSADSVPFADDRICNGLGSHAADPIFLAAALPAR